MLIVGHDKNEIQNLKREFSKSFQRRIWVLQKQIFGMRIIRDNKKNGKL